MREMQPRHKIMGNICEQRGVSGATMYIDKDSPCSDKYAHIILSSRVIIGLFFLSCFDLETFTNPVSFLTR